MTETVDTLETTDDAFLGGALRVLQPKHGYRAGLDAVILAATVSSLGRKPGHGPPRVLDAGSGVGVVGLCVARRLPDADLTLIERNPLLASLAQQNIDRNGLGAHVRIVAGDVSVGGGAIQPGGVLSGDIQPGSFHHVLANPPYYDERDGTSPPLPIKAEAHQMPSPDLDGWFRFIATATAAHGTATIIHRADALSAVLSGLEGRFGDVVVFPLFPRDGAPAHRILVRGRRGSRAPMRLLAGLVLHGAGHAFQPEVDDILRNGAALAIG
jgi:tRNA1(Val) A37 N6-methylase TrmN6